MTRSRLEANRQNAQKSTGPRTREGKAVSSQNAMRHGILSTQPVLPTESADDFEALRERLFRELQPKSVLEELAVEALTHSAWRLRRVWAAETSLLVEACRSEMEAVMNAGIEKAKPIGPTLADLMEGAPLDTLRRYETGLLRQIRALESNLRSTKRSPPEASPSQGLRVDGFVSQNPAIPSEGVSEPITPKATPPAMSDDISLSDSGGTKQNG